MAKKKKKGKLLTMDVWMFRNMPEMILLFLGVFCG